VLFRTLYCPERSFSFFPDSTKKFQTVRKNSGRLATLYVNHSDCSESTNIHTGVVCNYFSLLLVTLLTLQQESCPWPWSLPDKMIVLGTGFGHGGQILGPGYGFENRVLLTSLTITLRFELREGKITGFSST